MNKIFTFLAVLGGILINAQSSEILELRKISRDYDSILIQYQLKAVDSLSGISKRERNRIMAEHEKSINEKRRKLELDLLRKIKMIEDEENKNPVVKQNIKCDNDSQFTMPSLSTENRYKPTKSKDVKSGNQIFGEVSSIVKFTITADGYLKNVRASGTNPEFNKELELIMYKMDKKWTPVCQEGVAISQNFRMPVTMKFK